MRAILIFKIQRFWQRIHRSNKGFTLIELLIVIAIVGMLAAVIVTNATGLIGRGEDEAAAAELLAVQTAMDTMMVEEELTEVKKVNNGTSDMSKFPDKDYPLYPDYLRTATTTGEYTCDETGLVAQASTGYE